MNFETLRQDKWNEAYERRGNILFYPHEEIVRFINKYVRKRIGISDFSDVMPLSASEWKEFASLDIGYGIGRHIRFLDEFGLNPYGIDLSDGAIEEGKRWMRSLHRPDLADKMTVASVTKLPFEDESFHICVSHSVLDCMPRRTAKKGLDEAFRVLKKNGLMYLDFYMDDKKGDYEEPVLSGFDEGTIKSFFTVQGIKEFIGDKGTICELKIIRAEDAMAGSMEYGCRAHAAVRKNGVSV